MLSLLFTIRSYAKSLPDQNFFLISDGLPLYLVTDEISKFYNVNIMVYNDIKNNEIHATIKGSNIRQVLDSLSWLLGIEYVEKDGVYFLGSNTSTVIVLPNSGLSSNIEKIFKDVQVTTVDDKLVIAGNEREVAKVQSAYKQIQDREYAVFHMYALELSYDATLELGVNIDHAISYAFSWQALGQYNYNPIQAFAMSIKASLEASESDIYINRLIDTDLGLLSGKDITFQLGLDQDRPIYSESQYGDQSRVISGFNTQHTGLILKLKGFFDENNWFVNFDVENSHPESDLVKSLTVLSTMSKLSKDSSVHCLARIKETTVNRTFENGIPFLCDIPYAGYLFRVTNERQLKRELIFILQLKARQNITIPSDISSDSFLLDYSTYIKNLNK